MLVFLLAFSSAIIAVDVNAVTGTNISYEFKNNLAGYAEGTLTLESDTAGVYKLYWADDNAELSGYYPITKDPITGVDNISLSANSSYSFKFGYHTAIPAKATRIIAKNSSNAVVAQYSIPANKRLAVSDPLYKFNSYSDIHIDNNGFYNDAATHWAEALKFGVDKQTDFIVTSGDTVTNAAGPDGEWDKYEKILSESDYVNPVYESDGNHDMRVDTESGLKSFIRASGVDSTIEGYDSGKPYYYMREKNTGDLFIFMALEYGSNPNGCEEFSNEQMSWVSNLIAENYGKGINIYIVQHSPIDGFGAGDRMSRPYYKGHLSENYINTVKLKALFQKYPKLIWMSGHTHEDFAMGYNFSDENGTACSMIHNPSVAGSTWAGENDTSLDYKNGADYGKGYNSQGYLVEVYDNQVIYYGANLTKELIYPAYCYIMDGARGTSPEATNSTVEPTTKDPSSTTGVTGCTIPEKTPTQRVYFANKLKWATVDCHSWTVTNETVTCVWPGYGAVKCGTDNNGVDLYYCDIPAEHTGIVWNNGDNGKQTVDITLDGTNNFFTPDAETDGKYTVKASVWTYEPVTEPTESTQATEPTQASDVTEATEPSETTEVTEPSESSEVTEPSQPETETSEPTGATQEPVYQLGDVDMNGVIDINDATAIQYYLVSKIDFSEQQKELADTYVDGKINIRDVTNIQLFKAGLITVFSASRKTPGKKATGASMDEAKSYLDAYYSFASYDQYQNLKKLYKNNASAAQLDTAIAELKAIAEYIGKPLVFDFRDIYYFENTYNWANVYAYAWTGSSNNASWPGVKMQKVGTNYGHDVYGVKFDYAGQFKSIIFNSGQGGSQTVDVLLEKYEHNCFYISGTNSENKCEVGNFNFNSPVEPTIPTAPINNVGENEHYILMFYQSGIHTWNDKDTYFNYSNGEYTLDYTSTSSENISISLFDNKTSKFMSVPESKELLYSSGASGTYTLNTVSSRGKSITIKQLSSGAKLRFKYNPDSNTVMITCI